MPVGLDIPQPVLLTPLKQKLFRVGIGVCFLSFVVGCLGLYVLMDEPGDKWLSQTEFGKLYKRLVAFNPIFSAFFVNGGLLGMLMCFVKLRDHRKLIEETVQNQSEERSSEHAEKVEAKKTK
ncbi:hypothetical protein BSKO_08818 [Bryopsis sp. KO-2023]|nr:hypothetical protein BSKO_08818 [Bryopsis sp. KO-2023]